MHTFLLPAVLLAATCLAQAPQPLPTPPIATSVAIAAPLERAWVDSAPALDGKVWARGRHYKLGLSQAGASYLPLFGPDTPRHWPLSLDVAGDPVRRVTVEGETVQLHRGNMIERWHCRLDGAEQTFELLRRPADDRLTLHVLTDLTVEQGADGLRFTTPGLGGVHYGAAFAVTAAGKQPLPTQFIDGNLVITLPADASYPLHVDPFVSTLLVAAAAGTDARDPAVAYEGFENVWCVVYEERVNAFDTDIVVRRFETDGTLLDTDFAEAGTDECRDPAVAACNSTSEFLIVWESGSNDIDARRLVALAATPNPAQRLLPSGTLVNHYHRPAVGGSVQSGFLIGCIDDATGTGGSSTRLLRMSPSGTVSGVSTLNFSGSGCVDLAIADMPEDQPDWVVAVCHRGVTCTGGDIHYGVVNSIGQVEQPMTAISTGAFDIDQNVDVAFDGTDAVIVFDRNFGSHRDVLAQLIRRSAAGYQLVGGLRNLSANEPNVSVADDQRAAAIASDGIRFVYTYVEGSPGRPRAATIDVVGNGLVFHEGHEVLAGVAIEHENLAIATTGGPFGPPTRHLIVADEVDTTNDHDVKGYFYDGRSDGAFVTMLDTECQQGPHGANPFTLTTSGSAALGERVFVNLNGQQGFPMLLVGLPPVGGPQPLCTFGFSGTCKLGVQLPLLSSFFLAGLTVNIPTTPQTVGAQIAIQGLDVFASGGCNASLIGVPFNVSDTAVITAR